MIKQATYGWLFLWAHQMSETVNTAEIRVVADASGVEAGLRPAIDAAQRAERAISGIGTGSARSQQNLIQAIQRTTAEMEAGSRTGTRYFEVLAQQRGVDPGVLQPYLQQLRAVEQAQQGAGQSAGQTANALRQVPAQLTDIVTSLQGGMEPLTVLIQQGGQLRDAFGGIGPAAQALGSQLMALVNPYTLVAAATVAVSALYLDSIQTADAYARAIGETGNVAGVTADQLSEMARALGKGDAKEALIGLAKASQVSAENIQRFALIATEGQRVLGKAVADTVEEFDALGGAPSEALSKLNDKYHFLTAEVYAQVRALEDQGRAAEAATLAQQAYADGMEKQRYKVLESLSDWERGWLRIKQAASGAIDSILGVASASTNAQQITSLLKDRDRIEENIATARARRDTYAERQQQSLLDQNKTQINAIRARTDAEKAAAKAEADGRALQEARMRWDDQADAFLSKTAKREQEIAKARNEGAAAGASAAEIEERIGHIRKKYETKDSGAAAKKAAAERKEEAQLLAELSGVTASYMEDLSRLNGAYAKGNLGQERYVELVTELIGKQPGAKKMIEESAKEMADYAKSIASAEEALERELASITKQIQATKDQNEQIGLSKSAIAELEAARLDSMANRLEENSIIAEGLDLTGAKAEGMRKEASALRELAAEKRDGATRQAGADSAKQASEDWQKASETIEKSLTDALLRGFESGKGFGKNLVDTLKNMFSTLILRPTISAIVNPMAAAVTGALGLPGAAQAATGGAGVGSVANGLGTLGSLTSGVGLLGAGGLGLQAGFGALMSGGLAGISAAVSGGIAAIGAGTGASIAAGMGTIAGALGPIALGIGVAVKAFSRGPKEYTGAQTLNGALGMGTFSGTLEAEWVKKGGWLRSDKEGFDKKSVDPKLSAGLTSAYDAIKASSADFADVLGLNAASIASRSQAIKIALGKDEAANQAAIAEFFVGVANTVAAELLPEIGKFQAQGEQASATLQRLATNFSAVDQILAVMGATSQVAFGAVGKDSIEARERLVALAGGIEALAEKTNFFNDNFLSQAERIAKAQGPLNDQLAKLGFAGITTSEQFKEAAQGLVQSGALATASGAQQYAELLALGPQYKLVSDYLKQASDTAAEAAASILQERGQLQDEFDTLTMSATDLLGKQRAALDESNRALFDQIHAIKQQTAASEAATQALKNDASSLLGGVDGAYSVLQRVTDRQKKAMQEDIQMRTEAVNSLKTMSFALRSSLDGMRSPEQQEEDRYSGMAEVRAALAIAKAGGPLPAADALQKSLSKIGNGPSTAAYATYQDYQRDLFGAQGDLAELAKLTDGTLTVEEKNLKVTEDQVKQLDAMLARHQDQIDILKGQSTTGLSILDAVRALQGIMAAANANPLVAAGAAINNAYQQNLGRAPDAAGFEWWKNAAASGTPIDQIVGGIANSTEADLRKLYQGVLGRAPDAEGLQFWMKAYGPTMSEAEKADWLKAAQKDASSKLPGFAVGTNYVKTDMPAMIHEGERIMPAADNRELMRRLASPDGNAEALAAEVARLSTAIEAQQRENVELREALRDGMLAIATHTSNTASHLDDVVNGRKPLVTEAATA